MMVWTSFQPRASRPRVWRHLCSLLSRTVLEYFGACTILDLAWKRLDVFWPKKWVFGNLFFLYLLKFFTISQKWPLIFFLMLRAIRLAYFCFFWFKFENLAEFPSKNQAVSGNIGSDVLRFCSNSNQWKILWIWTIPENFFSFRQEFRILRH